MTDNDCMTYEMECCYGEHEDFDVKIECSVACGKTAPQVATVTHCGWEPPRVCLCGQPYEYATVR